jgi:hypothetical protein
MTDETRIALLNYDWMVRNRGLDDVSLHFESGTIVYGEGGAVMNCAAQGSLPPPSPEAWLRLVPAGEDRTVTAIRRSSLTLTEPSAAM